MRQGSTGTGALPMVRDALLAALDEICDELATGPRSGMLSRLQRMASAALDKPTGLGGGGGGGKASCDAALMALSLAAVAVRHMDPDRGGLAMAAVGRRLCGHADLRVREAVAGALPHLYRGYASHPGALEQMFEAYETLCNDKVWSVRQACARVVSELSELCSRADQSHPPPSPQQQQQHHHHQYQNQQKADEFQVRLLRDLLLDTLLLTKSQWVVTAAKQQAGAAIRTLRPGTPTTELLAPLLAAYCTAAAAVGPGAADVRRSCAESFGDVVLQAGPGCWSQLQPVLARLLTTNDKITICSLVASAERVVRLLATATATSDGGDDDAAGNIGGGDGRKTVLYEAARQVVSGPLLDVLRNQLHLAAPAASAAIAGLLDVSPPELQLELLQLLPSLCKPPAGEPGRCGDWRQRLSLASQLHAVMRAVGGAGTAKPEATSLIARCAVVMCEDPVWAVRQAAATQVGLMLADTVPSPAPSASGQCLGPPAGGEWAPGSPVVGTHGRNRVGSGDEEHNGTAPHQLHSSDQHSSPASWRSTDLATEAAEVGAAESGLAESLESDGGSVVRQGLNKDYVQDYDRGCDIGMERGQLGSLADDGSRGDAAGDKRKMGPEKESYSAEGAAGGLASAEEGCASSSAVCLTESLGWKASRVVLNLTTSQRAWLGRVLQGWQGCREVDAEQAQGGVRGGKGGGGASGGVGTSADDTVTAPELLAAWLGQTTLQGSRAEQALAVSCCQRAVPF
ncbi:hypothetical protein Vafri_16965 [Volvox africanus]|uniref:Uncharacterized protein n=1 Tax=Volvox africanus TaxID=51714 RepID=A0A8J4F780_9CHLO|nr:hypothetical protein Vafri_16965 [Volvox africanus]